jgi:hypothetical protein
MKIVFASIVIATLAATASAQTAEKPAKPAAKSTKPVDAKKSPAANKRQAAEEAIPTEEYDPSDKLSEAEVAISKRVYTGEIACELGAKVTVKPLRREGYFLVSRGVNRFVMHPVESRTGAIRPGRPGARRAVAAAGQQVDADEPEGRQAPGRRVPEPGAGCLRPGNEEPPAGEPAGACSGGAPAK